ncbi:MAG: hypothetical protein JW741_12025 [Sedimentisphaerales bacterium]|nr:hypothetical protein [Sedimentisphaerales bacterium]
MELSGAEAKDRIDQLVMDRMRLTGKPRHDCYAMVMRENPELRAALVKAANQR